MEIDMLAGLRDVSLSAVTRDDAEGYACGEAIALPAAVKLRRAWSGSWRDTYGDDGARRRVRAAAGVEAELRLAGVDPGRLVALGLWAGGGEDGVFSDGLPLGGRGYALRFAARTLNGDAFHCEYRVFWVEDIRLDDCVSRGEAPGVCEWIISGTLRRPRCGLYAWRVTRVANPSGFSAP
ncbi:MAG: hypothetical protein LBH66_08050 [Oscillospiraceae bacterium]|jgi:hypothetical protein|nr:hypothetical protein [Oscillospiraceae bacterium]